MRTALMSISTPSMTVSNLREPLQSWLLAEIIEAGFLHGNPESSLAAIAESEARPSAVSFNEEAETQPYDVESVEDE